MSGLCLFPLRAAPGVTLKGDALHLCVDLLPWRYGCGMWMYRKPETGEQPYQPKSPNPLLVGSFTKLSQNPSTALITSMKSSRPTGFTTYALARRS